MNNIDVFVLISIEERSTTLMKANVKKTENAVSNYDANYVSSGQLFFILMDFEILNEFCSKIDYKLDTCSTQLVLKHVDLINKNNHIEVYKPILITSGQLKILNFSTF